MRALITPVDAGNLESAAELHAVCWRASHAGICTPEFLAAHTTERQRDYLRKKLQGGSRIFLRLPPCRTSESFRPYRRYPSIRSVSPATRQQA